MDWEHALLERLRESVRASGRRAEELFAAWDGDGDGRMTREELMQGLQGLGLRVDAFEAGRLVALADADGDERLDVADTAVGDRDGRGVVLVAVVHESLVARSR